ncbi:hypothetical protein ACEQ8H_006043 [Pleosporales sp. CAS-2024a]
MYVLRPALRASTARPPARFIRRRRYPSPPRSRSFHATRTRAQAGEPASGSNNTPAGQKDAIDPDADKNAATEHEDAAVAADDSELLAQKLQRSRDTTRRYSAALQRRQQRSKKSQGLPPVHIPDWFLKRRVTRREEAVHGPGKRPGLPCLAVTLAHTESAEQATCSIPAPGDLDAVEVLSKLARGLWKRPLDEPEKRKIEQCLSERSASADRTNLRPSEESPDKMDPTLLPANDAEASSSHGDPDISAMGRRWKALFIDSWKSMHTASEQEQSDRRDTLARRLHELKKHLERPETVPNDPTWTPQQQHEAKLEKKETSLHKWFMTSMANMGSKVSSQRTMRQSISPLVLAEIRATTAASLSALKPFGDSFAAAKTNLILHSPEPRQEMIIDQYIHRLAEDLRSDLIVLSAQDLAQLGGDYLGEGSEPTPRSIRSLGYETYRMSSDLGGAMPDVAEPPDAAEAPEESSDMDNPSSSTEASGQPNVTAPIFGIGRLAFGVILDGSKNGFSASRSSDANANTNTNTTVNVSNDNTGRTPSHTEVQLEDIKLAVLLDALLDAEDLKHHRKLSRSEKESSPAQHSGRQGSTSSPPEYFDVSIESEGTAFELNSLVPQAEEAPASMTIDLRSSAPLPSMPERSKIIYVKDFKELNATYYGGRIIQKLEELVRKRRGAGESIMIIGSTCSRDLTPEFAVHGLQGEAETSFFRTIVVDGDLGTDQQDLEGSVSSYLKLDSGQAYVSPSEMLKFRNINLSHIREMLRSLDPAAAASIADVEQSPQFFGKWATMFTQLHFKRVLTYDEVHRIALVALGLSVTTPSSKLEGTAATTPQLNWAHVILAIGLIRASDSVKTKYFDKLAEIAKRPLSLEDQVESLEPGEKLKLKAKRQLDARIMQRQKELLQISKGATKHEKWLMPGIADPHQIKTTFDQVHVPPETIDSIRTITSLSLLRPDAFSYGILANEKISGALLYGPPGTGKTLLAKAVAKESGSTVLEVSGAQIMGKFVGESEKNVAAIFSLAQKLTPCIVFLDEADSIFGSRDAVVDRNGSHRHTLNQFLKEWDGLSNSQVFVMVATNRPFDLDDAVIRRLPRRLLVDLPTQADRKEILRIHLNGEQLDESVDLDDLAKRTPFYSGSDLKNIVVSAALASVKEENEQAARAAAEATLETKDPTQPDLTSSQGAAPTETLAPSSAKILHLVRGQAYNFPAKRTLHLRHFEKALQEISASISEDMSSLNAIKKFDQQYGDRRGKKPRKDFGFGVAHERTESAARVRL